jgi:asparagine synthetase B (glutamine-hydrolysing)
LTGDGADALIYATATALERCLRAGQYRKVLSDFFWLLAARRQFPRLGIRTLLRKARGRAAPSPFEPYPDWLAPALERRLRLHERWRSQNEAEHPRPGFELLHAYWPLWFESADPGSMHLAAEARYPFLDLRLARYLLRVPPFPWGADKNLLRVAMKGRLPQAILRRPKAPTAGNPWARLVPRAETHWWRPYMAPAAGLEDFVDVSRADATLARVLRAAQATNDHGDIDMLRSSLRPLSLNLWLRQTAHARFDAPSGFIQR